MKVKKIMTRDVVTLNQFMSLGEASEVLAKHGISGAPVVDPEGKVIGILTEADVLRAVSASADRVKMVYPSLHTMGVFFEMTRGEVELLKAFEEQAKTVVGDVMSKKVVTCKPDDDLNEAARILYTRNFSRVPVVDDEDRVVGIVSRSDIVRALSGLVNDNEAEDGTGPSE